MRSLVTARWCSCFHCPSRSAVGRDPLAQVVFQEQDLALEIGGEGRCRGHRCSFRRLRPSTACGRLRSPRGQFCQRLADLRGPGGELFPAERGQAHPEAGIDLAVPLLHPRLQLRQPRHQRNKPVITPAVLLPLPDDQRQGKRLLRVIPPGPAEQRRRIGLPARVRVQDEPLLRHIQLPPRLPVRVLPEVRRGVLRRHRDRPNVLPRILPPLKRPRLLPRLPLAQPGLLIPVRRQERHRLIGQQPHQRLRHRHIRPPLPQRQHRHHVRIPRHLISQLRNAARQRPPLRIKPEPPILQPIQQPIPQRPTPAASPTAPAPTAAYTPASPTTESPDLKR